MTLFWLAVDNLKVTVILLSVFDDMLKWPNFVFQQIWKQNYFDSNVFLFVAIVMKLLVKFRMHQKGVSSEGKKKKSLTLYIVLNKYNHTVNI